MSSIRSLGIEIKSEEVSCENLLGGAPERMLHSVLLMKEDLNHKRLYQVLFTGDRLLSISHLKEIIGNFSLSVDPVPRKTFVRYERSHILCQMPDQSDRDLITIFDESIFNQDQVHIALESGTQGCWINPNDLKLIYPEAKIMSVSVPGIGEGEFYDASGAIKEAHIESLKPLFKSRNIDLKPVLFSSTIDEISAILETGDVEIEDIEALIRTDFFLYGFIFGDYIQHKTGSKVAPTINEIVGEIGLEKILSLLESYIQPENHIDAKSINIQLSANFYIYIGLLTYLISEIAKKADNDIVGLNPGMAKVVARLTGYQSALWASSIDVSEREALKDQMDINRHRFISDIQKSAIGFDQLELASYSMKEAGYPEIIQKVVTNHTNPFYSGEGWELANVLYIVRSMMYDRNLASFDQFAPAGPGQSINRMLADRLGITEIIESAFSDIETETNRLNLLSWRFK